MSHAANMAMRTTNSNEQVQLTGRSQQSNKLQTANVTPTTILSQSGSSRSSSRRTSREPLPTPPPDPRVNNTDNIFKFPPTKQDYPPSFHGLLDFHERQTDFYKTLNRTITEDCQKMHAIGDHEKQKQHDDRPENIEEIHRCECCVRMREECSNFLDPFQKRASTSISATLAAYGAIEQLQRMYSIWDQYLDVESRLRKRKECLKYLNLLEKKANEEVQAMKRRNNANSKQCLSDTEAELEQSISLLDSILTNECSFSLKPPDTKIQRERSKSVMVDNVSSHQRKESRDSKDLSGRPLLLRRQSTYSDGKAGKVSKWTKVKAAFKWERANVPVLTDCSKDSLNNLTPINHEVARYLRVPSAPCGSSADSILSSSSGHLLGGTPGTISSASSIDDLENQRPFNYSRRRESAKSDTAIELGPDRIKADTDQQHKSLNVMPSKSPSNRSFRKSKIISDFEVLPEDVIADIKSTPTRRMKLPPSPLDLSLKQDLNDLENFYSPNLLKSPKDIVLSEQHSKKLNSPGNSSVPSSPSRHSDIFAEFESEELSSGEFSEPNTPTRKSFQQKQHEINKGYQILRAKLDMEFQAKRRQWEKMKTNPNTCRTLSLITSPSMEEPSAKPPIVQNLCAKQLEENLTPEFKKKLRKWRVKKQVPVGTSQSHHQLHQMPMSPTAESKAKIDWHLWKTGQLKLEGQGLCALPDQKNLPEDFQKKLEQWDKIKRCSSATTSGQDAVKRSSTKADCGKKSSDDDKVIDKRTEKFKPTEKDKSEKLAKLKAIGKLTDHPVKKIEVQTSEGVLKFEGISRKFTRKLYEWEKARGIGPESSTFALLHPGYCPIDVGKISKDNHKNDNSPVLSRSISLDSISIAVQLPAISQQASSLSLNDVNELKEMEMQSTTDLLDGNASYKKYEEPEAVMVEVEDDIVETASPLVTMFQSNHERQTPVYKYEETTCNDHCNLKRVISYESNTNIAPLLSVLSRTDKILAQLKKLPHELVSKIELKRCETELLFIRQIYPLYTENLAKPISLNTISDIQNELSRLNDLIEKSPLDEACCQETINECKEQYTQNLIGLYEALEFFRQHLHEGSRYPKELVPDINITSEDGLESSLHTACHTSSKDHLSTTLEATDELSCASVMENVEKPNITVHRTFSTNSAVGGGKRKLRLRKVGSRQNSKTETESSDDGTSNTAETPRRIKRKNFRLKQRSFDDDYRRFENNITSNNIAEDDLIKRKEKSSVTNYNMANYNKEKNTSKSLVTLNESSALFSIPEPTIDIADVNTNSNVFVKTKRKVFTTINAPTATEGIAVIEHDLEVTTQKEEDQEEEITKNARNTQKDKNEVKEVENEQEEHRDGEIRNTETCEINLQVKRKSLTTQKSQSLEDLTALQNNENKIRSINSLHSLNKETKVRIPLASDSFRAKSCLVLKKESTGIGRNSWFEAKREHLFKKNPLVLSKSNGVTVKKIETKIAKNNSVSSLEQVANKSDNTIPRIFRRTTRHSLTPTIVTSQQLNFEYPTPTGSEPTSPFVDNDENKPATPLSERAQKLRKAKEEFLKSAFPNTNKDRENVIRKQSLNHSRQSLDSTPATEDNGNLSKSVSVDTFTATTPLQSDAGTDMDSPNYDSLPRVSRSAKFTSKLGFATLASKFRRSKNKKDKESSSGSALSALCKQTLLADVITAPQMATVEERSYGVARHEFIASQSLPAAAGILSGKTNDKKDFGGNVRREIERLNKSQSDKFIEPRESYV